MKMRKLFIILLFIFFFHQHLVSSSSLLNIFSIGNNEQISCGFFLDGADPTSDVDWQESSNSISVNFRGFVHKHNELLGFEWCIISQEQVNNDLKSNSGDCRSQKGFSGEPDTFQWTRIQQQQTNQDENPQQITQKVSVDSLSLKPGLVYYAILHIFPLDNSQNLRIFSESNDTDNEGNNYDGIFINTNGTLILPLVREDWIEEIEDSEEDKQVKQDIRKEEEEKEMNRVEKKRIRRKERQVQIEVRKQGRRRRSIEDEREREREEEYFRGNKRVYGLGSLDNRTNGNMTDYDNDDDLTDGGIVGIVIAGIALLLICLIILLAIHYFATGLNKKDKYRETNKK